MPDVRPLALPDGYRARHPRSWQPWIDRLPELVATYLERWELAVAGEVADSSSYLVPVVRAEGRECVLKVQPTDVPGAFGAERELLGLRLAAPVTVEVVEEGAADGVLLLERVKPGTTLQDFAFDDDDAATASLAATIGDYGRPLDEPASLGLRPFEDLAECFERFDRGPHGRVARHKAAAASESRFSVLLGLDEIGTAVPLLRSARDTAERVLTELLADRHPACLLHGDLHHANVLRDEERGLRVIDPWGLYGDPLADVAPLLANPPGLVSGFADVDALLRRRLAVCEEVLEVDSEPLAAWCFVYCAIRALWALEDTDDVGETDARVRLVGALRRLI